MRLGDIMLFKQPYLIISRRKEHTLRLLANTPELYLSPFQNPGQLPF